MPPARTRPARPAAARPAREEDAWVEGEGDGDAPLVALVDAAVEARDLDPRGLAEALGLTTSAFRAALAAPSRLERAQLDRLAALLGVERAALHAAAAAARGSGEGADPIDGPDAETAETADDTAPGAPVPTASAARDRDDAAHDAAAHDTAAPDTEAPDAASPEPSDPAERREGDGSVAGLLERTVAAVADDALGRRVRLAILATARTAAAEAGRAAPAELHELRRRVQAGGVPWVGDGAIVLDERTAAADDAVLAAAAALVRDARRSASGYADLFAPVHDDALAELLRRLTVAVRAAALGATSACVVTPPLYGRYLLVCSADATDDQRRLALRRGVAHVLAGHVGELAPLPLPAPPDADRLADLFALADLVPFWQLDDWRRQARLGWRAVTAEVARTARALAGDWPDERAEDRAMLRVRLYRAHRI